MAKDKKSFIAYCDWLETFEECTDEEAGRLAKHLFRYVSDLNPEAPDRLTKMLFLDIKRSLKRDLKKYEARAERSRENGSKGGRPKTQKTQRVNSKPRKPDTVNGNGNGNVNDNVNVTVINKQIPAYEDFKEYALDKCSELNFNVSENQINAKYQSWKGNNWRNGNGKQIKNWKSTLLNTLPYMNQKETIEKPETVEEKDAREFMENLKKESINQILYPDVQSNFNDNEPANVSRVQRISNRPAGDGVDKAD